MHKRLSLHHLAGIIGLSLVVVVTVATVALAPSAPAYAADQQSATPSDPAAGEETPPPAFTQDGPKCVGTNTSIDFKCDDTQDNGIWALLIVALNFVSIGVGIAVAGGIIWGGLTYATAQGNASQTQKGVTIIVNAVIGLLLYLFLFAIAQFLIPGGIFT